MQCSRVFAASVSVGLFVMIGANAGLAQKDPGPRPGPAAAGSFYPSLNAYEQTYFSGAQATFQEVENVTGSDNVGLGPAFNGNSCAQCHAEPAMGGSSPGTRSKVNPIPNPQVALATLEGAQNTVPSFITVDGPVREARFIRQPDGSADGGVHDLFTIAGRSDAPGCSLAQPDFAQALRANNVIFRIPTPVFGLGMVENTPDSVLRSNLAATAGQRNALRIRGTFNTSGNDGTITRFGWKAQNKSLMMFSGEAYNVEEGISNELFPNDRAAVPGCMFSSTPDDTTNMVNPNSTSANYHTAVGTATEMSSDIVNFSIFMRLSAPPVAASQNEDTRRGGQLFASVGCALCHSSTLTTGQSQYTGMSNVAYHPYSDFAIHHMGRGLSDGVSQGAAGPDQFRTAPLWGVGQRLFFLHDGRTGDLLQAIQQHASSGSEANQVVQRFNSLNQRQQQSILDFLRSL
jgi:CxxC motif-containing protein (DUF1111 family)